MSNELSTDTQAVLLLCGTLGRAGTVRPLTLAEYNRLVLWLRNNRYRPGDLLANDLVQAVPHGDDFPSPDRLKALLDRGRQLGLALTKWANFGVWVVSRGDATYPERLRRLGKKAPPLLFGAGPITLLNVGGLAVVGSRDIDEEAAEFTRRVASRCAEQNVQIVSGGARGVDHEAITAALKMGGTASAILSDNLLKVVTNPSSRDAIRDQRLTVVSPFNPEARFSIHAAMERNKSIYALADFALVVRFKTKKGGTWAGVDEQLRHNGGALDVPVFVRVKNNPEDGLRLLQNVGARPFPEEEFDQGRIIDLLAAQAANPPSRFLFNVDAGAEPPIKSPPTLNTQDPSPDVKTVSASQEGFNPVAAVLVESKPETCYDRCVNLILQALRDGPSLQDLKPIARRLELTLNQFKTWLKRAISDGRVAKKKKGRKVHYVVPAVTPASLFPENMQ